MAAIPDLVFAGLMLVAAAAITVFARRRNWRTATTFNGRVHGAVTILGIEWNTNNSSTRLGWDKIIKVRRARNLTLVFYAPRSAFYFPRSFFESDNAWQLFNESLVANIPDHRR